MLPLFSNHSTVDQEQIIFIINIIKHRQESDRLGILFIDSYDPLLQELKIWRISTAKLLVKKAKLR